MNINDLRISSSRLYLPTLIVSLFVVYLTTLAPGLTWANGGSDGGDLITAAYTGGIAHPTGYPLYLFLARLFQYIPIGTLAFRTNLMTMLAAICSAILIYMLVVRVLKNIKSKGAKLAGMTAGFAFGLSPLVWSQAVITEVYALQAFLTVLILFLFIYPVDGSNLKFLERMRGLVIGLAMGNHVTTIFLLPLILFSENRTKRIAAPIKMDEVTSFASSLTRQLVWFSIGLSIYLSLPLRALNNPPVNWGNPVTLKRFWWLISGELYRDYYLQFQLDGIGERLQAWASLLIQQFGLPGVALGVVGVIFFFKPTRLYFYSIWVSVIYSVFAILYTADDSYVYLIPLYIVFSIWIGLAVGNGLTRFALRSNLLQFSIGILLVGYFLVHAIGFAKQVDASHDSRAEIFGRQVMTEVPKNALVFVKGDQVVFTTWYFHFALEQRPDMVVIANDLLHFDWYQDALESTYPKLNFPNEVPWHQAISNANPERTVCFVQYTDQAEIDCE